MLAIALDRRGHAADDHGILALGDQHIAQGHAPCRHRPRLVEHDHRSSTRVLQHLGPANEDAQLRAATRADQDRGRRGKSESARAGDDEHRHRRGEGRLDLPGREQPGGQRDERNPDDDGHEDRRDAVGQALHRGFARLGLHHQAGDARQLRVGTDARRPHGEDPIDVDRGADDRIADPDLDRHRLTREQ